MTKRLAVFAFALLVLGATFIIAAWGWIGQDAEVRCATAFAVCFFPAVATFAWAAWTQTRSPELELVAILGGTGIRMAVVLAAGWTLSAAVPALNQPAFWIWLLVFYLASLGLEMALLLSGRSGVTNVGCR